MENKSLNNTPFLFTDEQLNKLRKDSDNLDHIITPERMNELFDEEFGLGKSIEKKSKTLVKSHKSKQNKI